MKIKYLTTLAMFVILGLACRLPVKEKPEVKKKVISTEIKNMEAEDISNSQANRPSPGMVRNSGQEDQLAYKNIIVTIP